jgi:hypothetical protein
MNISLELTFFMTIGRTRLILFARFRIFILFIVPVNSFFLFLFKNGYIFIYITVYLDVSMCLAVWITVEIKYNKLIMRVFIYYVIKLFFH